MNTLIFRSLMDKNYERINKKHEEVAGMGMRKGFHGFFGGLPFSPWGAGMKPWGWQKEFNGQIVESTPSGAFRINPGVPDISNTFNGFSSMPFDYIRGKLYETAWKLNRVKNITPKMKTRFQGDLDFMLNSFKQMYPFDYNNNFSKLRRSINNAFKSSSGSGVNKGLMDAIYELDFLKRKSGYSNISFL